LRLMGADLEQLQKQYKVPLNSQMFIKSNPKGMALILHTLLCLFDEDQYRPMFSVCWFPYTMVELKEFKAIALQICTDHLLR
jgi:HAUS augmin-like complex subunit 6 N-terminus